MCKYVSYILKVDKNLNKGINQFSKMTKKKKKPKKPQTKRTILPIFANLGALGLTLIRPWVLLTPVPEWCHGPKNRPCPAPSSPTTQLQLNSSFSRG
jgi:hypothetical protein